MRVLLIIFFFFPAIASKAQFGQAGATWIYNDLIGGTNQNFPRSILSIADTVIQGQACKIIIGDCACGTSQTNFLYGSNGKVYWFNAALNSFTLLYNFNLNAGDEWTVVANNTTSDSLVLKVDSTGFVDINGVIRKIQHIHTVSTFGTAYLLEGPVIEEIGSMFCLYPQFAGCDPPTAGLRCYEDDSLGLYDTHFAPSCEEIFVDSGIGINEPAKHGSAKFIPNPFHDEATLIVDDLAFREMKLEVSDATGRMVCRQDIKSRESRFIREFLREGVYIYKLISHESVISGKFIII